MKGRSGNPAVAVKQDEERRRRAEVRKERKDGVPLNQDVAKVGLLRRGWNWFFDWLPFVVIGFVVGMFTIASYWVSEGNMSTSFAVFLSPLVVTWFVMPRGARLYRAWRWLVVYVLTMYSTTQASYVIPVVGIAWLLHQTYRVEFPRTSLIHHSVEKAKAWVRSKRNRNEKRRPTS